MTIRFRWWRVLGLMACSAARSALAPIIGGLAFLVGFVLLVFYWPNITEAK